MLFPNLEIEPNSFDALELPDKNPSQIVLFCVPKNKVSGNTLF